MEPRGLRLEWLYNRTPMPLGRGVRLGVYEVVAPLGAGGMGEVYRARDTKLGREVALKILPGSFANDAERMARFEREAKLLASLNHTNIAAIYGFEDSSGVHALVMELVEGQTLGERIAKGPIPIDETLPVAKQIAEGLEYAHERGIVHRDLKPANVKITPDGVVKILDFGLAKALSGETAAADPSSSPTLSHMATQAGIILGTAAYMAPEQAKGKPVDRRADIWAFGCVLYEMLAGKKPFEGETVTDILAAVVRAEPDWSLLPASIPLPIRKLLLRCLNKDPKQRLRDIGEARIGIEGVLSGAAQDSASVPATAVAEASKLHGLRWLPWALVGALAVLAIVLGWLSFGRKIESRPVLRFAVNPPQNAEFGPSVALSPDGTRLVFAATANGKDMLWLRPLNSVQAQPISGTENGAFPFWSPDGKSIGFFADNELKRVDLGTGSVVTICQVAGESRGASWGSDGTILFAPGVASPLMKVSATGGTPSPATVLDPSHRGTSNRWPFFLPDGRHFLFQDEHVGTAESAVAVGSLDSSKPYQILPVHSDSSVIYAAGFLLYSWNGSLVAQAFDPDRLKVTGNPVPIASHVSPVGIVGPTGYLDVSASANGILAYRNSVPLESQLTIVDRDGKTLGTIGPTRSYSSPSLSPDGKKIVVGIPDPQNPAANSLWIVDVASGAFTRLTFDNHDNIIPIWSPHGRWIYFSSNSAGPYNLYRKRSDGSGPRQLLRRSADIESPTDVSLDGRYLLFADLSPVTSYDLWYLPLQPLGKAVPYLRTPAVEGTGRFSPDGRWVAYAYSQSGAMTDEELFVSPFPATGSKWQVSSNGGTWPVWSASGHQLYFVSGDKLMEAKVLPGSAFQFQPPQPLFSYRPADNPQETSRDYSVFPGGQKFLLNQLVDTAGNLPITVVANWTVALKGR